MLKIFKLLFTNSPVKRFRIELSLMFYYHNKIRFLRKIFQRRLYYIYHCHISNQAYIDESVTFIHPLAIVIGSNAIIEKNCSIYQSVTLGSTLNNQNKMPHIKENTIIYAGAKLIGDITIGKNCIIGANTVVTKNIPDNSIVVGVNKIHPRSDI